MRAKYVIFRKGTTTMAAVVSEFQNHSDVLSMYDISRENVVGAGFFEVAAKPEGGLGIKCWGESVTVRASSRKEADARILERWFGGEEIFG